MQHRFKGKKNGFSLMQTSIALAVSAIVLSAVLPGGGTSDESTKIALSKQRMAAIEEATKKFMATNYRRPCPADGTLATTHASFGAELSTPGTCSSPNFGPPTARTLTGVAMASSTIVAGIVPVRALGLPDEYALDGFGRRFMYVVDRNATSSTTCRNVQSAGLKGVVRIRNASTDTVASDLVMAALISYGKDGHGAFPAGGSTVANRINTYTSDANSQTNAFVNSSFTYTNNTTFTVDPGSVIKREASSTFDDIVYYDESVKDKCCIGLRCSQGFRIDADADGVLDATAGINYAVGDFNADGFKDIAVSNYNNPDGNVVSVFLSSSTGWPVGTSGVSLSGTASWVINNDNSIPYLGYSIAAGDLTSDSKDDLLVLGEGVGLVIHTSPIDVSADTILYTSNIIDSGRYDSGVNITHFGTGKPGASVMADIDGDGYKEAIFTTQETPSAAGINAGSETGVIWGRDYWAFDKTIDFTDAADGFYFYSNSLLGFPLAFNAYLHSLAVGNINGDYNGSIPYQDIVFGAPTLIPPSSGAVASIFGRARGSWGTAKIASDLGAVWSRAVESDILTGTTGTLLLDDLGGGYLGQSVAVADMNRDGYDDWIAASSVFVIGVHGKNTPFASPANLSTGMNFYVETFTNRPAAATVNNNKNILNATDVNADGRPDILLSNSSAYMSNAANAGMTYVLFNPTTSLGYASNGFSAHSLFSVANSGYDNFNGTKGFVIEGATSDYISNAGVIDINWDKKMDIIVAAPGYSGNTSALYILYGRGNTDWRTRTTAASATPASWPKIDLTDFNQ